jgi:hypothetical protein
LAFDGQLHRELLLAAIIILLTNCRERRDYGERDRHAEHGSPLRVKG